GERRFPQEQERDWVRREPAHAREPERESVVRVVQVVERVHDGERGQVVGAEIIQTRDAQLDERRAEVRPREQDAHEKDWIAVDESARALPRLSRPSVNGERVAARREGEDEEDVDGGHLVVIEVAEASEQSFVKDEE